MRNKASFRSILQKKLFSLNNYFKQWKHTILNCLYLERMFRALKWIHGWYMQNMLVNGPGIWLNVFFVWFLFPAFPNSWSITKNYLGYCQLIWSYRYHCKLSLQKQSCLGLIFSRSSWSHLDFLSMADLYFFSGNKF